MVAKGSVGALVGARGRDARRLASAGVVTAAACLSAAGCLSPLAKQTAAFSTAAGLVVDGSEQAYRDANRLRQQEQTAAAVYGYDRTPGWTPYTGFRPLLTPAQLNARITVLDGLKAYAATLAQLAGSQGGKDLDTAAAGVGANLKTLSANVAADLKSTAPDAPVLNAAQADGVSTALRALGEYLIARKVKGSLRRVTETMNPAVRTLCGLLADEVGVLRRQADVDYQTLVEQQDRFIRSPPAPLGPLERRDEIGKLITLVEQQRANDALLAQLQTALRTLAQAHQALTDAALGNDPVTIRQRIAQLEAAGQSLESFASSLPAK